MKAIEKYFGTALLFSGMVLFVTGCGKEGASTTNSNSSTNSTSIYTSESKGAVKFYTTSDPKTKTTYSGWYSDDGYERIDWVKDDEFVVWSDLASVNGAGKKHDSDYKVTNVTPSGRYSDAGVANVGKNGLWWKDDTSEHTYYAVYPATTPYDTTANTFKGTIPATQSVNVSRENYKIKDTTDLSTNGYMVAAIKQTHTDNGGKVPLNFEPAFTAFEIRLKSAADAIEIYSASLTSTSTALSGDFTGSFSNLSTSGATYSYLCPAYAEGTNNTLTKTFGSEGVKGNPTITTDSTLVFTFLALPQDLTDLTLSFETSEGKRSLKLKQNDAFIKFEACKKHILKGLAMTTGELNFSYITLDVAAAEWTDVDYKTEYTNVISTNQFAVKNATMAREYLAALAGKAGAEAAGYTDESSAEYKAKFAEDSTEAYKNTYKFARQTWICKSSTDTKVTFKVLSPQKSKWAWTIKPNGDFDAFEDIRVKTNEGIEGTTRNITTADGVSGNLVDNNTTYFTIHFTPSSTTEYKVMYFTVLLTDPDGNVINIDFTTQLYEKRGYHYFVLNATDDQLKEINKDVIDK